MPVTSYAQECSKTDEKIPKIGVRQALDERGHLRERGSDLEGGLGGRSSVEQRGNLKVQSVCKLLQSLDGDVDQAAFQTADRLDGEISALSENCLREPLRGPGGTHVLPEDREGSRAGHGGAASPAPPKEPMIRQATQ